MPNLSSRSVIDVQLGSLAAPLNIGHGWRPCAELACRQKSCAPPLADLYAHPSALTHSCHHSGPHRPAESQSPAAIESTLMPALKVFRAYTILLELPLSGLAQSCPCQAQ